jgi:hypothetical protein
MKGDTSLRTVEPLAAIRKHPGAATFAGAFTGLVFGVMGATIEGGAVGALMAVVGIIIGAPGGAHIAEAAES